MMSIVVRKMTRADLETADRIAMAAYESPNSYAAILGLYLDLQPDGWRLALLNGEPAGLGGVVDFGPFAYLGMMSVLPTARKRGLGQVLMESLLSWLDARGCPTVLLNARAQAVSLYERSGFVTREQTRQIQFPAPAPAPELVPGVSLMVQADLPALAEFDAPAFGASRLAVLSAYFEANPRRCFVSRNAQGQLTGFLYARQRAIGPWHAANTEAADALFQQAQLLPYTGTYNVSVSEKNTAALALLAHHQGTPLATLAHMYRGQPLARDPHQRIYSLASLMLG